MEGTQRARRVYSAEELHRLRNAYSLPKLREAIEEREGEDAEVVKEHVLRGSKSFAARSFRSRTAAHSLRVPSTASNNENTPFVSTHEEGHQLPREASRPTGFVLSEVAANSQVFRPGIYKLGPSPTPSIKRKKAEAIVKAHGSPTHIRVTAGGRIVPSEQSPLCHPRYGYSAVKVNGGLIKFAPNHYAGKAQWTRATENGFVAQDVYGNLCQIVNGTVLPLNQVDGALRLYIPAPNLKVTQRGSSQGPMQVHPISNSDQNTQSPHAEAPIPQEPPLPSQISALELEYSKLEHDLKDVDKTEVIHGRTMGKVAKQALITRRRELVLSMDKVRKALKALKNQPPHNAPTSPRATCNMPSSLSAPSFPSFASQQGAGDDITPPQSQNLYTQYGGIVPSTFPGQFGMPSYLPHHGLATPQSWAIGNTGGYFPPTYDGTTAAPFPPVYEEDFVSAFGQMSIADPLSVNNTLAQGDRPSSHDDGQGRSPTRSHAVPIKAPEKTANSSKPGLNPMSPAYKPLARVKQASDKSTDDSVKSATGSSPCRSLPAPQPSRRSENNSLASIGEGPSPTKKAAHLQSSSVSSFETADFFPRNTSEYSTRPETNSCRREATRDKENEAPECNRPVTPCQEESEPEWTTATSRGAYKDLSPPLERPQAPAPPPGTPVQPDEILSKASMPIRVDDAVWDRQHKRFASDSLPDRAAHNVSPKNKRGSLFATEDLSRPQKPGSPTLEHSYAGPHMIASDVTPPTSMINFAQKPRAWIQGYQAGLQRRAVAGDSFGDFLDGYCEGLLKSTPSDPGLPHNLNSAGSSSEQAIRRPSPSALKWISARQQQDERQANMQDAPIEVDWASINSLKKAIIAPPNENAILTPTTESPHVAEHALNLGAWAKSHHSCGVGNRGIPLSRIFSESKADKSIATTLTERRVTSDLGTTTQCRDEPVITRPQLATGLISHHTPDMQSVENAEPSTVSSFSPTSSGSINPSSGAAERSAIRLGSMTSIDSTLYRPWLGYRVVSPHLEVRSASSISRVASLAAGFFAPTQLDGSAQANRTTTYSPQAAPPHQHDRHPNRTGGNSDQPPTSSPLGSPVPSPRKTPVKNSPRKQSGMQNKSPSPAKAKIEQLAEKVGMKVSSSAKAQALDDRDSSTTAVGVERVSPSGKRRWRDVWRGGARKEDAR